MMQFSCPEGMLQSTFSISKSKNSALTRTIDSQHSDSPKISILSYPHLKITFANDRI